MNLRDDGLSIVESATDGDILPMTISLFTLSERVSMSDYQLIVIMNVKDQKKRAAVLLRFQTDRPSP